MFVICDVDLDNMSDMVAFAQTFEQIRSFETHPDLNARVELN